MEFLRYPIGRFEPRPTLAPDARVTLIEQLAALPAAFAAAVTPLTGAQLDTPYRAGGWTVRQVVHHLPDSHLNGYARCKLALTESEPTIKPYDQAAWAALPDSAGPIAPSLLLLDSLHRRWVDVLRNLGDEQWQRRFIHPENGPMSLEHVLQLYAWHGRHHLAQITGLIERSGWQAQPDRTP